MAKETETRSGVCATHGTVDATREIPRAGFPYIINAFRRARARKQPYRCPACGAAVTTG
jgi:predicted RNA-binding Zn-ribbon protein involved in translation (DUF1610 family)